MSADRKLVAASTVSADVGLEKLLIHMTRYGKPRLMMFNGWLCNIEMNTNTTGTSFEVKSEFGMATPLAAAVQCNERIEAALRQLGGVG